MGRSKSSGRWLREHFSDPYVERARREGYRARAVYKLQELDEREGLLKPGMTVVDLGAAPGGWSQYVARKLGDSGKIIACDLLPMDSIVGVVQIHGDFSAPDIFAEVLAQIGTQGADLVISDMAPSISGVSVSDQFRSIHLLELALELAQSALKPSGSLVAKMFQGEGVDNYMRQLRANFHKVSSRKPKASRPRSRELYVIAKGAKFAHPASHS